MTNLLWSFLAQSAIVALLLRKIIYLVQIFPKSLSKDLCFCSFPPRLCHSHVLVSGNDMPTYSVPHPRHAHHVIKMRGAVHAVSELAGLEDTYYIHSKCMKYSACNLKSRIPHICE